MKTSIELKNSEELTKSTARSDIAVINDFNRIKRITPNRTVFVRNITSSNIYEYADIMDYYGKVKMIIHNKVFINCIFFNINFKNIVFTDCYFTECTFDNCVFNCTMATCIIDKQCTFSRCNTTDLNLTIRLRNTDISPIDYKNSYIKLANKRKYFYSMRNSSKFNALHNNIKGYKLLIYNIDYNIKYTLNKENLDILKRIKAIGIDNIYVCCTVLLEKGARVTPTIYGSLIKSNQIKVIDFKVPIAKYELALGDMIRSISKIVHEGRLILPEHENNIKVDQFVSKKYNSTDTLYSFGLNNNRLDRFGGITLYTDSQEMTLDLNRNLNILLG